MLLRSLLGKQRRPLASLLPSTSLPSRAASSKAGRLPPLPPSAPKTGSGAGRNATEATSTPSIPFAAGNSSNPSPQSALRNRKLTPAAKAKAQTSASRALREQLAAVAGAGLNPEVEHAADSSASQVQLSAADTSVQNQPLVRKLYDAIAYATAEQYDFEILISSGRLPAGWQLLEENQVLYIPHWPNPTPSAGPGPSSNLSTSIYGEVFVFRSGSYVTWGLSGDQSRRFLRMVVQGRPGTGKSAEVAAYTEVGDEAMEYLVAEDQMTRIVGDVIVIGHAPRPEADEHFDPELMDETAGSATEDSTDWSPLLARLAFSQGLMRSARLSVQEAALTDYLEEVASLPSRLELEGKVPLHRKEVIRKMGTLLRLRQRANLDSENFLDDPEMYWENWKVEHHYDSICSTLDIETRFKAYNEKLDHGENLLGVLRALLTESSTHRMELIIIYLIAFEVCLALISHEYVPSPKRVWDLLTGQVVLLATKSEEAEDQELVGSEDLDRHAISYLRRLVAREAASSTSLEVTGRLV